MSYAYSLSMVPITPLYSTFAEEIPMNYKYFHIGNLFGDENTDSVSYRITVFRNYEIILMSNPDQFETLMPVRKNDI